jgi:phospholipase C
MLGGPGTRIPAVIISPFAKKGTVDHTLYDTTSILRFITRRFDLPVLAGLKARDDAMMAAGSGHLGDLTAALDLNDR